MAGLVPDCLRLPGQRLKKLDDILRLDGGTGQIGDRVGGDGPEDLRLCVTDVLHRFFGVALDRFGQRRVGYVQVLQGTRFCELFLPRLYSGGCGRASVKGLRLMIEASVSHRSHACKVAAAAILSLAYADRVHEDLMTWYMGFLFGTLHQIQRRNRRIWYRTSRNETTVRRI